MARKVVPVHSVEPGGRLVRRAVELPPYDEERFEDVAFMTAMTLVLLTNYAGSGHYGGPLAATPLNVAAHLGGPDLGALRYDVREPKHPFSDRFLLAGATASPRATRSG